MVRKDIHAKQMQILREREKKTYAKMNSWAILLICKRKEDMSAL